MATPEVPRPKSSGSPWKRVREQAGALGQHAQTLTAQRAPEVPATTDPGVLPDGSPPAYSTVDEAAPKPSEVSFNHAEFVQEAVRMLALPGGEFLAACKGPEVQQQQDKLWKKAADLQAEAQTYLQQAREEPDLKRKALLADKAKSQSDYASHYFALIDALTIKNQQALGPEGDGTILELDEKILREREPNPKIDKEFQEQCDQARQSVAPGAEYRQALMNHTPPGELPKLPPEQEFEALISMPIKRLDEHTLQIIQSRCYVLQLEDNTLTPEQKDRLALLENRAILRRSLFLFSDGADLVPTSKEDLRRAAYACEMAGEDVLYMQMNAPQGPVQTAIAEGRGQAIRAKNGGSPAVEQQEPREEFSERMGALQSTHSSLVEEQGQRAQSASSYAQLGRGGGTGSIQTRPQAARVQARVQAPACKPLAPEAALGQLKAWDVAAYKSTQLKKGSNGVYAFNAGQESYQLKQSESGIQIVQPGSTNVEALVDRALEITMATYYPGEAEMTFSPKPKALEAVMVEKIKAQIADSPALYEGKTVKVGSTVVVQAGQLATAEQDASVSVTASRPTARS